MNDTIAVKAPFFGIRRFQPFAWKRTVRRHDPDLELERALQQNELAKLIDASHIERDYLSPADWGFRIF